MEKTNWIEKIKEAIRVAMNRGLFVNGYKDDVDTFTFYIEEKGIYIYFYEKYISICTRHGGYLDINYDLTDRDELELQALVISIKEYRENMAISEFEKFISSDKDNKPKDINDLDNEDD